MTWKTLPVRRFATSSDLACGANEGLHPALIALRDHALGAPPAPEPRRPAWVRPAEAAAYVLSPPLTVFTAYAVAAGSLTGAAPWAWVSFHMVFAVVLPLGMLVAMHQRGEVEDIDVTDPRQREKPLMIALLATGLSLYVMQTMTAPALLIRLTVAQLIIVGVALAASRYWRFSIHAAGIAAAGTVLWLTRGSPAGLIIGVVAVVLLRVALGRHTLTQAATGAVLGWALTLALLS